MASSLSGSVTVHMQAPPDRVWALVSDVTRIGSFSPETFEAEWLDGATGPAVGARFRGHVKRNGRGPVYWTTCTVTASEPGKEFAFSVGVKDTVVNTWRYELLAAGGGTDVTESFALKDSMFTRIYWAIAGTARGRTNRNGMQGPSRASRPWSSPTRVREARTRRRRRRTAPRSVPTPVRTPPRTRPRAKRRRNRRQANQAWRRLPAPRSEYQTCRRFA